MTNNGWTESSAMENACVCVNTIMNRPPNKNIASIPATSRWIKQESDCGKKSKFGRIHKWGQIQIHHAHPNSLNLESDIKKKIVEDHLSSQAICSHFFHVFIWAHSDFLHLSHKCIFCFISFAFELLHCPKL